MKTVFANSYAVMHAYAQQNQPEGKNSSRNVYFEGPRIYSYGRHYLLGEIFTPKNKDPYIVINDSGYSVTTSKHISQLTSATRQYKQFFTSNVDIDQCYSNIQGLKSKLANARKPELYTRPMLSHWNRLNEFIEYTKATDIKKSDKYKELKKIMKALSDPAALDKLKQLDKKLKAQRAAKAKKELRDRLQKFYNHELSYVSNNTGTDYLRLSKDKTNVETTQGVKVPAREALILYKMILAGKDIKGYKIEGYTVISINGTLKIGCHNICTDSMHKVGKELIELFTL